MSYTRNNEVYFNSFPPHCQEQIFSRSCKKITLQRSPPREERGALIPYIFSSAPAAAAAPMNTIGWSFFSGVNFTHTKMAAAKRIASSRG